MHNEGSVKAIYAALGANSAIAVSKFVVSFITGSSTMLAEAIHSTADCFNQVLLLIGNKRSQKPADETHSFGYGKEEYFWSMLVAVVLFALGSVFAIYEGIHKTMHPEAVTNAYWIFGLLALAIGAEYKSFMVALGIHKKNNPGGFVDGLKKSTDTSLVVVLIEDSAAMVGLVIAFVLTILSVFVHPIFDGIGSILIGGILGYMTFFLSNELRQLIVGESVSREITNDIKNIIRTYNVVDHINNFRTMYIGRNKFLLNTSLDVNDEKRAGDIESIIFEMKTEIRAKYPEATFITIEISSVKNS